MINSNLAYLLQFLQRKELMFAKDLMKIRSAELQAVISSAEQKIFSGVLDEVKICVNNKIVRKLSIDQKILLYELITLLSLEESKQGWFAVLRIDLSELFSRLGIKQNYRYSYLSVLSDNQFAYRYDEILSVARARTNFFRRLRNPVKDDQDRVIYSDIYEVLYSIIKTTRVIFIYKNKPKKKVFRKGYNDHGSLGSEFSKTLKQQSSDWSLNELERKRQLNQENFTKFLLGFEGWI